VLSNPGVTCAMSGMNTIELIDENIATASSDEPLSDDERRATEATLQENRRLSELYCTGCNYCMPCPEEVNIPAIFAAYNQARVYGLWENARKSYASMAKAPGRKGRQADACIECGECEEKCPQNIPIRERLKEAHEALTKDS
jgi:hypothetical protein